MVGYQQRFHMTDVSRMTLAEVQAELAEGLGLVSEHMERRALLWRRFDALVRLRPLRYSWPRSTPRPWTTGKQEQRSKP